MQTFNLNPADLDLKHVVYKLKQKEPFAFSRFGDGEWACLLGAPGQTCDGQTYLPALGALLRLALETPERPDLPYWRAIGPAALRIHRFEIADYLISHPTAFVQWYDTEAFINASLAGSMRPLCQVLNRRSILYVGPDHLRQLNKTMFSLRRFVAIPPKDCFNHLEAIQKGIASALALWPDIDLIGFSCGPVANVLIDWLYRVNERPLTLIDFGSVFDLYCGVKSRSYMRNLEDRRVKKLLNLNSAIGGKV